MRRTPTMTALTNIVSTLLLVHDGYKFRQFQM